MTSLAPNLANLLLLPQVLCSALEMIINKAIKLSAVDISLASLTQQTLTLELSELPFPLCVTVCDDKIIVGSETAQSDCTINSSVKILHQLKAGQELTHLIKQDKLAVNGDIKVAQQFSALFEKISIDWQSELAKYLGDIATHKLVNLSKKIGKNITSFSEKWQTDTGEYIVHEKNLTITKSQLNQLTLQIEQISTEIEAASRRIEQLAKKIK